jgi:Polymorphic toxin system, DSP-PTPase phosphatase
MNENSNEFVLADPRSQPDVLESVSVPDAFYWVIERPAPLAGMRDPLGSGVVDWAELSREGFDSVVCLSAAQQNYDPSPLTTAWCGELEDLAGSWPPQDPRSELLKIEQAARAVSRELNAGHGVVVHCLGGIGRTGTVLAAPLVLLGFEPAASIEHVIALNAARACHWPEAAWHLKAIEQLAHTVRGSA